MTTDRRATAAGFIADGMAPEAALIAAGYSPKNASGLAPHAVGYLTKLGLLAPSASGSGEEQTVEAKAEPAPSAPERTTDAPPQPVVERPARGRQRDRR